MNFNKVIVFQAYCAYILYWGAIQYLFYEHGVYGTYHSVQGHTKQLYYAMADGGNSFAVIFFKLRYFKQNEMFNTSKVQYKILNAE